MNDSDMIQREETEELPDLDMEVKTRLYFEIQGNKETDVEEAMEKQMQELEKNFDVIGSNVEDLIRVEPDSTENPLEKGSSLDEEDMFSINSEALIECSLGELVGVAIRYTPSIVEIESPGSFDFSSKELLSLFGKVSNILSRMTEELGPVIDLPDLDVDVSTEEDLDQVEIYDLVQDGNVWFRMVLEAYGGDEETVVERVLKYLSAHGTRVTNYVVRNDSDSRFEGQIAVEGLSRFENLFILNAEFVPTAFSVIEPEEKVIAAREMQNVLTDLAGVSFELTHRHIFQEKVTNE